MRDLYKILGVEREADFTIIKSRYRELARQLHPDRTSGDPVKVRESKERKFKEVVAAYTILGNEQRRAAYDREWQRGPKGTPGTMFGPEFDDIIERVKTEGVSQDNLEDLFVDIVDFAQKFQAGAPDKVRQAASRLEEESDGTLMGAIETLFGLVDKTPRRKR